MSTNFIIFEPIDQKLWVFEVLGEVWARLAWARANEVELTKVPKSGGRRKEKRGRQQGKKKDPCVAGRRLLVVGWPWLSDLWSAIAGRLTAGDQRSGTGRH
jgi:hypothetical protein